MERGVEELEIGEDRRSSSDKMRILVDGKGTAAGGEIGRGSVRSERGNDRTIVRGQMEGVVKVKGEV